MIIDGVQIDLKLHHALKAKVNVQKTWKNEQRQMLCKTFKNSSKSEFKIQYLLHITNIYAKMISIQF